MQTYKNIKVEHDDKWEGNVARAVIEHNEYDIDPQGTVVDIGGHIGSFTLKACDNGCDVYTFEPTQNYKKIKNNLKLNGFKAKVFNKAVVGKKRKFTMSWNEANTGSSRETDGGYEVETITFDEVMDMVDHVDVLKLDCEGTEHEFNIEDHYEKIDVIVGEIHWKTDFIDRIKPYYEVKKQPSNAKNCWIIYASRIDRKEE